jgi:phage terminase large subunit GpA-like protein
VPATAWFLTAGADVQEDVVKYVVRAWAPHKTSWLVDWGAFEREDGDETLLLKTDLVRLREVLERRYPVVGDDTNTRGERDVLVRLLCCDANHRTMDVHEWVRSVPIRWRTGRGARLRAVRGDVKVDPSQRYRLTIVEKNSRTGQPYKGGLKLWGIYVYHYYMDLAQRLSGLPGQSGSWHVTADCLDRGKTYLKEVTNFHRIDRRRKSDKRVVRIWQPKTPNLGNDYWDCEVYAMTAADMVVGQVGWDGQSWERIWGVESNKTKGPSRMTADYAHR